jgi:Calcineurin-like phosphoesterase
MTIVRLWIVSDLHLELTRGWDLPGPAERPDFDVLVVAGDLIPRAERGVRWLLERVHDRPVIYVMGNHESYGTDEIRTVEKAMEAAQGTQVFILQNRAIRLGDVTFAGCCLWTDFALYGDRPRAMAVAGDRMNDFSKIRTGAYRLRFRPAHALRRHEESRAFLEAEMRKPRGAGRLVVVTHHAPVPDRAHRRDPAVRPTDDEILTAAYRSDLTSLMRPQPAGDGKDALRPADAWIFGHTDESFDSRIGDTRVVSNSKGYGPWFPKEKTWDNPNFDPHFILEI